MRHSVEKKSYGRFALAVAVCFCVDAAVQLMPQASRKNILRSFQSARFVNRRLSETDWSRSLARGASKWPRPAMNDRYSRGQLLATAWYGAPSMRGTVCWQRAIATVVLST